MQTKKNRVGQQFGNYRLTRHIGYGGYAEVYLAEHVHLPEQWAIKVLTETNLMDSQQEEFLDEARTIAKLHKLSSHIVQIHDVGIQPAKDEQGVNIGIPYLVMEYASEGTLRNLYPHDTIVPLERIAYYVNQIAEALQCAHDQSPPIVHRDIKPENMLLRSRGHVLLSDFGIAATGQTGPLAIPSKTIPGTAAYIAPERFSHHLRRASDQYSLAIVVYEWLCGYCPFDGTSEEICYKHITAQPPPLYPQNPHVTREIESVVMKALAKQPEARYDTVQAFAHALEGAIQSALRQRQQQQWQAEVTAGQLAQQQLPPTVNPGVQGRPRLNLRREGSPQNNNGSTTVPQVRKQALPVSIPVPDASKAVKKQPKKILDSKIFSFEFPEDGKDVTFLICGLVLNILPALFIGLLLLFLLRNIAVALTTGIGAFIVIMLIFSLFVSAIERKIAVFFGALIALYWGGIGGGILNLIALSLNINRSLFLSALTWFTGFIFFIISFILHLTYMSRKKL